MAPGSDPVAISKFLSHALRHAPASYGLTMDAQGWVAVADILARAPMPLDRATLDAVAAGSDKRRFAFSPDGTRLRANQGHSVAVDLGLAPQTPPDLLWHGTATRFLASIRAEGLKPGARRHVHLSADRETAARVGARHGKPAILTVRSGAMAAAGHIFHLSDNNVWLTAAVPLAFLDFPD